MSNEDTHTRIEQLVSGTTELAVYSHLKKEERHPPRRPAFDVQLSMPSFRRPCRFVSNKHVCISLRSIFEKLSRLYNARSMSLQWIF